MEKYTIILRNRKRQEGITLIALVITVIVLLILAAVTIAMLTGSNGILNQTEEAKEMTKIKNIEEDLNLELLDLKIEQSGLATVEQIVARLQEKGKIEAQSEEDKNSNRIRSGR